MAFHLYRINELYSNADGSIQYVELVGLANNQQFLAAHTLTSTQGGVTRSFTFPANLSSSATLNKSVLIATQAFANLGLVTPDYILPTPFLFTDGGTVNFAESSSIVTYAALPTDGSQSIDANAVPGTNSPTNFAGASASIPTVDTTAPTVSNFNPADEATGVAVTSNLVFTFSEAIQRGTGSIVLKNAAGTVIETLEAATSTNLSISGSTLTVNPTNNLGSGTGYKLEFPAGSVKDLAGNSYAGTTEYNFTTTGTPDTIPPVAPKLVTSAAFYYLVDPQVTMQTTQGAIVLDLYPEQAPVTVANMLAYVNSGFYNNTIFHSVNPNFVLQGGVYTTALVSKTPTYGPIVLESNNGLSNLRGTIGMVRDSTADSATSQFFLNLLNNTNLNYASSASPGYAVFGKIVSGLSVIDTIAQVPTSGSPNYVPVSNVVISSLTQTLAGSATTNSATLTVSALEANAQWSYSLDGGTNWTAGVGSSFLVPVGTYAANAIQVRQTDAAGNLSATTGKYSSVLVVETTPPTVANFSPADEAIGFAADSNIVVTFSEAVQRGSGTIVLRNAAGAVIETYNAATSANLSFSGSTLTINPSNDLAYLTGHKLEFAAGSVKDLAGNSYAGTTTYNFTSGPDTTPPVAPKLITNAAFNFLIDPQVTLQTSMGTVVLDLYPEQAPVTVANMLAYVNSGFYANTLFHRVIPTFMIQGGGFTDGLVNKTPTYAPIVLESNNGLSNLRGTIAMARTTDPDSATSQFFINRVDNTFLNYSSAASPGYAAFGQVVSGLAVVDSIAQVPTAVVGQFADVPISNVTITSFTQTLAGSSITNAATLAVGALESGAQWSYSLDGGATWTAGIGTSFTVPVGTYAANAIQVRQTDTAGNLSATTGKLTSALVVEVTAPTIDNYSPADEAIGIAVNSNIVITFSETIARGTGTILLKNAAGTVIESFAVASSSRLAVSGSTLTIDPGNDLQSHTGYTVELAAGVIRDLAGNGFIGTSSYNFTTFNNAPTASTFGNRIAGVNEVLSLNLGMLFNDIDGDALSFGASGLPSGIAINSITGEISGPLTNAAGLHHIVVTGTDSGGLAASVAFDLTVATGPYFVTRGGNPLLEVTTQDIAVATGSFHTFSRGIADFLVGGTTKPITAADALDALKLSVGLAASKGNSWKELIAADMNHNGVVTAADALEILKTSVGINTIQPSWVFVPTDPAFNSALGGMTRSTVTYADKIDISAITNSTSSSVTGILVGDVNNSWLIPA
jgi:cyclophilin family peptidyl-prolyl cis-trans isomerase/methionine-rich copper-binding protein CopC